MRDALVLSLTEGVTFHPEPRGVAIFEAHSEKLIIQNLNDGVLYALNILAAGEVAQDRLEKLVIQKAGTLQLSTFYYCLRTLERAGAICFVVWNGREKFATFLPTSPYYVPDRPEVLPRGKHLLSRFAYLRRDGGRILLESPLSHSRVLLHSQNAVAFLQTLARPSTLQQLKRTLNGLNESVLKILLSLLAAHQFLANEAEEQEPLIEWEFHDLLFHVKSRMGRNSTPLGTTYRFDGKIDPLPAVRHRNSGEMIPLVKSDLPKLKNHDPSFAKVVEERQSLRSYDEENPITVQQLGEFLFRVARTKEIYGPNPSAGLLYQVATRPYPGGGGCYELEFYLTVRNCVGIDPGFYHYEPCEHQLCKISGPSARTETLLNDARNACNESAPQVLIMLAARFARVSWKYQRMAYATILKDVGVLYQTMYLTATAMGLAPCALGAGDSDLFAQLAGTNYYAETSVGEFMLGSRKT